MKPASTPFQPHPIRAEVELEEVFDPNSEVRGARPPRALLDAHLRPAFSAGGGFQTSAPFLAAGVFREGAENSARGGRAPLSTSEFLFNNATPGVQSVRITPLRSPRRWASVHPEVVGAPASGPARPCPGGCPVCAVLVEERKNQSRPREQSDFKPA